ncbi:MAG: CHASE domain-containing protein, partial [Phycisphaerae bacterium]|nr:CHASE domain-containing protein [Phycisphaerae bacterium]
MMAEGGKGRGDTGHWDFSLRACVLLTAVVVCVGAFVSLFLFEATRRWQRHRLQVHFERAARDRISTLKREIDADLLILQALVRFYSGSQKVERDEFRTFVAGFLLSHPHIQALEWVPRVRDSQRAAYEAAARKDGYGNFEITERAGQGQMVRAPRRQEYFPVYFVEPYKGNEIALGFDLASSPARLEALNRSCDMGKAAATARVTLVQETGRQFGLLVFLPVYKKGAPTDSVDDRRANLEGF